MAANMANADKSENLWVDILVEVQSSSRTKLPTSKSLLVLGDNECGKTTLISKLQGAGEVRKGSGLEFMYVNVKDEYRDDQTRLGAWILDGDLDYRGLLRYALTEHSYAHTMALLVASLARPWDVMDALQRWADVLGAHAHRLRVPSDVRAKCEATLLREYQDYVYPDDVTLQSTIRRPPGGSTSSDPGGDTAPATLPLGPGTLTRNLGIPVVVVLTQSDAVSTIEKDFDYRDEQWDFVQQHVRLFCLQYGAALVYTSVKEDKNVDLLSRYLVHRIYGLPFNSPACVVEKDAVFIPAGWDNDKKVGILAESSLCARHPNAEFNDVITKPLAKKPTHREPETTTDDDQMFLLKMQSQLASLPAAPTTAAGGGGALRESPQRSAMQSAPAGPRPSMTPPSKKMDLGSVRVEHCVAQAGDPIKAGAVPNDTGVLANFFNSLLTKKTVATANDNSVNQSDHTALSKDAAAELSRMTQGRSSPSPSHTSSTSSVPSPNTPGGATDFQNNATDSAA